MAAILTAFPVKVEPERSHQDLHEQVAWQVQLAAKDILTALVISPPSSAKAQRALVERHIWSAVQCALALAGDMDRGLLARIKGQGI